MEDNRLRSENQQNLCDFWMFGYNMDTPLRRWSESTNLHNPPSIICNLKCVSCFFQYFSILEISFQTMVDWG